MSLSQSLGLGRGRKIENYGEFGGVQISNLDVGSTAINLGDACAKIDLDVGSSASAPATSSE